MKLFRDRSIRANASFYMTMISLIQSLALGYFATTLKPDSLFAPVSFAAWLFSFFSYGLVVQMIVITWHEYSIGAICYTWPLGYSDSWIPILLGFCEYFVITFATAGHLPYSFAGGRSVPYFFIALTAFAVLGWVAFYNQYQKVVTDRMENREILALVEPYLISTRRLMFGNIFTYFFGFLATWWCSREWVSVLFLVAGNATLIFHAVRSKRVYDRVFAPDA